MKNIKVIALVIFAVLVIAYFGLKLVVNDQQKSNAFSFSEIKNDDSTYNYVKKQCESGIFGKDSQNCKNLRKAR
ncbi:hypothetical protein [Variovorax sp. LT1R16]|uniref:hypothetical protein n=1 Tax=Variovorax sp. LT1R16 TaxID=3443728 RepID=UPI003F472629